MANKLYAILIALLLVLVLVAAARTTRPTADRQGHGIQQPGTWAAEPDILRVGTFNIQSGKNLHGKRDILQAAAAVAAAHIVGIQEVHAASWANRLGLGVPQTNILAAAGNFGYLYAAARRRWLREYRGNALLSKLPISAWKIKMLPDQTGKRYRNMIIANFTWQGETVVLINTHLHTEAGREQQLSVVLQEFARHPRAILLGDLNSESDTPLLQQALANNDIIDAIAAAGLHLHEPHRIDWILTRGFTVIDGLVLEKGISDHPYFQVSLALRDDSLERQ